MKKRYEKPIAMIDIIEEENIIATSDIDYGGGNTGDDKPHVAEVEEENWDIWSDDSND